jgi:hypothetical protein
LANQPQVVEGEGIGDYTAPAVSSEVDGHSGIVTRLLQDRYLHPATRSLKLMPAGACISLRASRRPPGRQPRLASSHR